MNPWNVTIRIQQDRTMLLVTDWTGDVLKARLTTCPAHPRALLTLLEGLALWSGQSPLCVATSVAASAPRSAVMALLGGDVWPAESPLVQMDFSEPPARRRRIRGLGDFRALHQLAGGAR